MPCRGKVPLTPHGYKDASKDAEAVKRLFANCPQANTGIATGKVSGIFVLDIDIKNGAGGAESLTGLEREHVPLPPTVEVKTCSGGRHLYFRYPESGVGCKTGIRKGIDIRGDGGYVVAPPSVIDGKSYEWTNGPDTPLADAPDWLLEFISPKGSQPDLSDKDALITQNRNNTLMLMGVNLRKMGLEHGEIEKNLQSINAARCSPPLDKAEVSKIARSVSRYDKDGKQSEPLTDTWNARFFYAGYGGDIRYCDALGGWFIWDGTRWRKDESFQIMRLAQSAVQDMRSRAKATDDKALLKHAAHCEAESRLKAMVNLVRCEDGITVTPDTFDSDVFVLNCRNGTLDLRTGGLRPHNKADYLTRRLELDYKADAQCPEWLKFMDSIFLGDKEIIGFMQKAVGYSLSGSMKEQCVFILYGVGMNGKSTFLKHIYRILGEYAMNTPATTLMEKYGESIPNDVARLKGARFVTSIESGKGRALAEAQIKQLTGDDPISARFLHREFFDFFATFKIFLATNHKPNISGTDKGIWRRLMTIPFEKVITPEERDPALDDKLAKEYAGILAWAAEGFRQWQKDGLCAPDKIARATNEYREESDIIGNFITENCVLGDGQQVSAGEILKAIQQWAKDGGMRSIKRTEFIDYMQKRGFKRDRITGGKTCWFGITLKGNEQETLPMGRDYEPEDPDVRPF